MPSATVLKNVFARSHILGTVVVAVETRRFSGSRSDCAAVPAVAGRGQRTQAGAHSRSETLRGFQFQWSVFPFLAALVEVKERKMKSEIESAVVSSH